MSLKFVDPPNGPPPAASYRHLAVVPPGRRLLVLAGQIGNLSDGTIVEGLEAQYEQALININTIVASEGAPQRISPESPFSLWRSQLDLDSPEKLAKSIFPQGHLP